MTHQMRWGALGVLASETARHGGRGTPGVATRFRAVPRMAKSVVSGRYPGLAPARLLMMAAATLYIVSPADLLPEGLFAIFGLGDDAMVTAWLAMTLSREATAFIDWESSQGGRSTAWDRS